MIYYSLVTATLFVESLVELPNFQHRRKDAVDIMSSLWDKSFRHDAPDRSLRLVSGDDLAEIMPEDVFNAFFQSNPIIYKIED